MMDHRGRIETVRKHIQEQDADAAVFSGGPAAQYFSGFQMYSDGTSAAWYPLVVIPAEDAARLIVGGLDSEAAAEQSTIDHVVPDNGFSDAVKDMLDEGATVLLEDSISAGLYSRLSDGLQPEFDEAVGDVRAVKEEAEVERITAAAEVTETVLGDIIDSIDADSTENSIAGDIERGMRRAGGRSGFPAIVAAGQRSAHPHHAPRDTAVGEGPLLFDVGARMDGYVADVARTVHLGEPSDRFREVYEAVRGAQDAAEAELADGAAAADVDAAARDVLEDHGFPDGYPHAVGHGVGLSVHEPPKLSGASDAELAAGNVVTLEPGVYIPDAFGVRIEDVYVVREDGADRLTTSSRRLEEHIIEV
ncbi:MAG: Xaa-Pro peptidase family protein [Candidatus Nanohaloarchaea archaeon]|nr:Xaa-Pro peptidase family protein [Candidatus Nanohaloarchaea archaeon]